MRHRSHSFPSRYLITLFFQTPLHRGGESRIRIQRFIGPGNESENTPQCGSSRRPDRHTGRPSDQPGGSSDCGACNHTERASRGGIAAPTGAMRHSGSAGLLPARLDLLFRRVSSIQEKPIVRPENRVRPRTSRRSNGQEQRPGDETQPSGSSSRPNSYCHPDTSYPFSLRHRLTKLI